MHGHIVLLGDSIFDNAVYVPGGPSVIEHVRRVLPIGWKATLLAIDGARMSSVERQLQRLPADATGSQFPDLYAVPFGEYHVAEGTSPAFAPVTLNHSHTVWSVVRNAVAGAGTVQPLVLTAFVTTWSVTVTASPGKDSRAKPSSNRLN